MAIRINRPNTAINSSITKSIRSNQEQQTNQPIDQQDTFNLLREFVKDHIDERVAAMKPEIQDQINNLVGEAKADVVKEITESKNELQNVKNSVMGAIAVFAAFFTFVSVNVNIFTKSNAIESLALMIVMWICLMGFTYTFFLFLWDKWRTSKFWAPIVIGMIITCGILWFVKNTTTVAINQIEATQPH